ncbi:hypothetical protein M2905_04950 [Vagococcus lutrae]|uniref:hypothetical protein n=1 Tax=Vagococcus lutrae TaxID=81947 RepID=UPI00200EF8A5|nr:hypothetical protein [Vagococcus lutrae]UQF18030.1 hypothetical protein M2905_04950 [Vagococcus lutrae]
MRQKIYFSILTIFLMINIGGMPVILRNIKLIKLLEHGLTICLIVFALFFLTRKGISSKFFMLYISIILFLLFYLYLGNLNGDKMAVLNFIKYAFENMLYLLIFLISIKYLGVQNIRKSLMVVSFYVCVFAIFDWIQFMNEGINYFYRASGNFGNPNTLGQTILFLQSTISAISIQESDKKQKKYFCIITFLNSFVVLITQSRGSIILMVIILILNLYYKNKFKMKEILLTSSIIIMVYLFLKEMLNFNNMYYFTRLKGDNLTEFSNGRIDALYVGIKSISFIGLGIGKTSNNILNLSSHNIYVHMLQESGLIMLLIMLIYLVFKLYNNKENILTKSTILLLVGLLGTGFFTHNLIYRFSTYIYIVLISYFKKGKSEWELKNSI